MFYKLIKQGRLYKVLLVVFLLNLSACADIDKGLYSVSNVVASPDRVTGQRSLNFLSRSKQIEESNKIDQQILEEYEKNGLAINEQVDADEYDRLQRIFKRVHSVSHLKDEEWEVYLLPFPEFNAFTTGGTRIFINKGLMDESMRDDEIAVIIGHEIAHVTANHIYERKTHIIAGNLKGSKSVKSSSFQKAFTYKNEKEADEVGLLYSVLAGYDPSAAPHLWERIYNKEGDYSEVAISHPVNSHRYKRTAELAEIYKKYYQAGKVNQNASEILRTNEIFGSNKREPEHLEPGKGAGLLAVLEAAGNTMTNHYEAQSEQYKQLANQRLVKYVNNSIEYIELRIIDSKTLAVPFVYKGIYPIKNLNLNVLIGGERANDHSSDLVIQPNSEMIAEFQFEKLDLNNVNLNSAVISVTHVEK